MVSDDMCNDEEIRAEFKDGANADTAVMEASIVAAVVSFMVLLFVV